MLGPAVRMVTTARSDSLGRNTRLSVVTDSDQAKNVWNARKTF